MIREAADCDDLQLNFGVIANEAMGDSVKVTVIATGFAKPEAKDARRESVIEPKPAAEFFAERPAESAYAAPPDPVVEPHAGVRRIGLRRGTGCARVPAPGQAAQLEYFHGSCENAAGSAYISDAGPHRLFPPSGAEAVRLAA